MVVSGPSGAEVATSFDQANETISRGSTIFAGAVVLDVPADGAYQVNITVDATEVLVAPSLGQKFPLARQRVPSGSHRRARRPLRSNASNHRGRASRPNGCHSRVSGHRGDIDGCASGVVPRPSHGHRQNDADNALPVDRCTQVRDPRRTATSELHSNGHPRQGNGDGYAEACDSPKHAGQTRTVSRWKGVVIA